MLLARKTAKRQPESLPFNLPTWFQIRSFNYTSLLPFQTNTHARSQTQHWLVWFACQSDANSNLLLLLPPLVRLFACSVPRLNQPPLNLCSIWRELRKPSKPQLERRLLLAPSRLRSLICEQADPNPSRSVPLPLPLLCYTHINTLQSWRPQKPLLLNIPGSLASFGIRSQVGSVTWTPKLAESKMQINHIFQILKWWPALQLEASQSWVCWDLEVRSCRVRELGSEWEY